MPKKTAKIISKKNAVNERSQAKTSNGTTFNIGNVRAERDVILGDQSNTFYQTSQILNISTRGEFVTELGQFKSEIERLKNLPNIDSTAIRHLEVVEGNVQDVIIEAKKEKPIGERIKTTLDSAKETMEKLGGSIATAVKLGTTLGNLALIAMKLFGG